MPRPTLPFVALAIALVAVFITVKFYFGPGGGGSHAAGGGPAMLAGAPAQSYEVRALSGKSDALANYRGHVVLVNLWASWCAPCRSETPALEQLYRENRSKGLVVLGIDQGESANAVASFVREMRLSYPLLLDEGEQYGRAYAAIGLPTSLVVDPSGHIVRGIDGEMTLAQMREAIHPLLRAQ